MCAPDQPIHCVYTVDTLRVHGDTVTTTKIWVAHCARSVSITETPFFGTHTRQGCGTTPSNSSFGCWSQKGGVGQPNLRAVAQLHYLKVAEVQRRGLAHFHCVLRLDGPESIDAEPPAWASAELHECVVRSSIERARAPDVDGRPVRWGRVYDIEDLAQREEEAVKVAAYVAKYAAKTTDSSKELARGFRSRRQIVSLVDDPHMRRLALTAWDLGGEAKYELLRLRDHARTFGFTGQLITKSRAFSTTFAALRSARIDYMAAERDGDPVEGTFHFEGRGCDNPRATQLAELFFTMQRELREEVRARERSKSDGATS